MDTTGTKYVVYSCMGERLMPTTDTKYTSSVLVFLEWVPRVPNMACIGVWGSSLWVPRVLSILLLCGCFCNGYHGYQVCRIFVSGGAI